MTQIITTQKNRGVAQTEVSPRESPKLLCMGSGVPPGREAPGNLESASWGWRCSAWSSLSSGLQEGHWAVA